jgi:ArsR family metal-binding transcriptional regulator
MECTKCYEKEKSQDCKTYKLKIWKGEKVEKVFVLVAENWKKVNLLLSLQGNYRLESSYKMTEISQRNYIYEY